MRCKNLQKKFAKKICKKNLQNDHFLGHFSASVPKSAQGSAKFLTIFGQNWKGLQKYPEWPKWLIFGPLSLQKKKKNEPILSRWITFALMSPKVFISSNSKIFSFSWKFSPRSAPPGRGVMLFPCVDKNSATACVRRAALAASTQASACEKPQKWPRKSNPPKNSQKPSQISYLSNWYSSHSSS